MDLKTTFNGDRKIKHILSLTAVFTRILLIMSALSIQAGVKAQQASLFRELEPRESGIRFRNMLDETEELNYLVYEYFNIGGGVALGDVNNDGLADIFLTGNMRPDRLYLNGGDLHFEDVSSKSGVSDGRKHWTTGVSMADVNADGWLDIYVCYSGNNPPAERRNRLYINLQDGEFSEQARKYGLDDPSNSIQAAFFDFDLDGDLDMYLMNHNTTVIHERDFERARQERHPYAGDKLFENRDGKFTDISESAGIRGTALGFGLGISVSDINLDGLPDIYITNDYLEPDYLYINQGDGTFRDEMTDYFQHISLSSMGNDVADYNNDLYPDILAQDMLPDDHKRRKLQYVPEIYEQYAKHVLTGFYHSTMRNMLHLNNGNGSFSEIGQLAGVHKTDWSWGPLFADLDNDGWKDLFMTTGFQRDFTNRDYRNFLQQYQFRMMVRKEEPDTLYLVQYPPETPIRNYLYHNNRDLTFTDRSEEWGFGNPGWTNGAAYADLDNDGDLDLVLNNLNHTATVMENLANELWPERAHLDVLLKGTGMNRNALNAKVFLYADTLHQFAELLPVRGFQSTVTNLIHFGLGEIRRIDSLVVIWPDGRITRKYRVNTGKTLILDQKKSEPRYGKGFQSPDPEYGTFFTRIQDPFNFRHKTFPSNDFERQPLLLNMISNSGPCTAVADVNGDGLEDMVFGGGKGELSILLVQLPDGSFRKEKLHGEDPDRSVEDLVFADVDGDGDPDLYAACGGYNDFLRNDADFQDMLYLNDGSGTFIVSKDRLPAMLSNKTCIAVCDFEGDSDADFFVGGGCIPGEYPLAAESYLLINDGNGRFLNVLPAIMPELSRIGMISDAEWVDLDMDGFEDLVVAGDFMPVMVYLNRKGTGLQEATWQFLDTSLSGRWSAMETADLDLDGDEDLVLGNFGQNTLLEASPEEPLGLYYGDFDVNGFVDPVFTYHSDGLVYPLASRYEMLEQIKSLERSFPTHEAYSVATLKEIFPGPLLERAGYAEVTILSSMILLNEDGRLSPMELPLQAQFAPVYAIEIADFNRDGYPDLILAGNQSATRVRLGPVDANFGQLFLGDGGGNFRYVPQLISGLKTRGDARSVSILNYLGNNLLVFGVNNSTAEFYLTGNPMLKP